MFIKKFDYSIEMAESIIDIDRYTFNDIKVSKEQLCDMLNESVGYDLYVGYVDFVPVGFIGLMKAFTPHYSGWWIDLLAVLPEFQSKGIGSEFVEFAINHYKLDDLILTALIRNDNFASVKAIMKNGFNKMGENDFSLFVLD